MVRTAGNRGPSNDYKSDVFDMSCQYEPNLIMINFREKGLNTITYITYTIT
jgi:hypothetical protein